MILQGKTRAPVREAVLHCAAIKTGQFAHMRAFQVFSTVNRWHIERGFANGFGYHGLIMPDGSYYSGRPYEMVGAHVKGRNLGTLGFLLIESREIKPPEDCKDHVGWLAQQSFLSWYTEAQKFRLLSLLGGIDGLQKVSGHNDYAAKLCPGFKVKSDDWL